MFCLFKFRKCELEIQKLKPDTLRVTPEKIQCQAILLLDTVPPCVRCTLRHQGRVWRREFQRQVKFITTQSGSKNTK
jgi:hypothetical protein